MDNKDKATNEMERDHEQEEEQNPNNNNNNNNNNNELSVQEEERGANLEQQQQQQQQQQQPLRARTPFTDLSQVDADLVLARTLQEQEREYSRLRMNSEGSDYGSWEAGTYFHDDDYDDFGGADDESDAVDNENDGYDGIDLDDEDKDDEDEDAFDVHAHDESEDDIINPSIEYDSDVFSSDEAYARALQDAEEREMAARLLALAGINDRDVEDPEDHSDSLDTWEDVDPDELSYEELLALGEVVGTESRGLSTDTIASLPTINYKNGSSQNGSNDSCVICRLDFEDGETLTVLSCNHSYHSECVNNWLKINKVCPVCSAEVSTSGHS